jgi:hypothetical protein
VDLLAYLLERNDCPWALRFVKNRLTQPVVVRAVFLSEALSCLIGTRLKAGINIRPIVYAAITLKGVPVATMRAVVARIFDHSKFTVHYCPK